MIIFPYLQRNFLLLFDIHTTSYAEHLNDQR